MILIRSKQERTRFIKFMVVGTIGFLVDFSVFNLCRSGIGISPEVSSVISFIVAVLSNFTFNRFWTYPDSRSKPILNQLAQFGLVNVVGLAIRTTIFALINAPLAQMAEKLVHDFVIPGYVIGENVALAIVVIIVMLWNFFANRYWTYNDVD
jgi:putative flippase GtrA